MLGFSYGNVSHFEAADLKPPGVLVVQLVV